MCQKFYLNPSTVKTECDEGISTCIKETSNVASAINSYSEISNTTDIKCAGFNCEKELVEDMKAYFSMINAMITEYQNSYFKLKNTVGDEVLDSEELQHDAQLLSAVSMNLGTSFKAGFNASTKSLDKLLGKEYSAHRQQSMQQIQNVNNKVDEAKAIIEQKTEKYNQIENATKALFDAGNGYKSTAEKILASVQKGAVKDGNYSQDKKASWRKEYKSYSKKLNELYDERNNLYFESKNLTKEQIQKYTKSNNCTSDDLYDTLINIEKNDDKKGTSLNCAVNIIKGDYKAAFKGIKTDDLNEYAKRFVQTNGFNKYYYFNSNPDDKNAEKDLEKFYNAMLDDGVDRSHKEAYERSKGFIELMKQGAEDVYKKLISRTADICEKDEGNEYKSSTTQYMLKALVRSESYVMFVNGIYCQFKEKEYNYKVDSLPGNPYAPYRLSYSIYNWPKKITSISYPSDTDVKDNRVDDVKITMDIYDSFYLKTKSKNVTEKFYQSKERLDSEIEWARRESEIKEGPHAVKDWREDTIKSAIIAGASAIDPVYGICAGLVVSISNDELDKDKALEIAGEVYGECDDNLDINKKIKDISKEPLNGMRNSVSRIPGVSKFKNSSALVRSGGIVKGSAGAFMSMDNLSGLWAAIEQDKNFTKDKREELEKMLARSTKTYISNQVEDGKEHAMEFPNGDLGSELTIRKIKNGELTKDVQEKLNEYVLNGEKDPNSKKTFEDWYKDEKEIKVYGLSFAEVKKIAKKGVSKNMSNSELIKYMEVCREVEKYIGTQSSNTLATKITEEKNKIEENLGF